MMDQLEWCMADVEFAIDLTSSKVVAVFVLLLFSLFLDDLKVNMLMSRLRKYFNYYLWNQYLPV